MLSQVLAVAGEDGVREGATFGGILLVGLPIVVGIAATLIVLGRYGGELSSGGWIAEEARLLTHSSAFWARWPGNRLWDAPYAELAAEASRCEQLVTLTQARMRPRRVGQSDTRPGDQVHRKLAAYQGMVAAVRAAMAQAAARQGRPHH